MSAPIASHITAAVQQYVARIRLRGYQEELVRAVNLAWAGGATNVLAVLPTGGGKTVLFGRIVADFNGASCCIAHRQELVSQISLALARYGVRHRIIGPKNVVQMIVRAHMAEVGTNFVDPSARCAVAGVDTLIKRGDQYRHWAGTVGLWVQDEAHHVTAANKWGQAAQQFPNARGLGVTATPCRADGKGLGRHADGLFDVMVQGPTMRWLIDEGYLTDYRIFAPPGDFNRDSVEISTTTGDFKPQSLKAATRQSHITGDIVDHYMRLPAGRRAIVFATDVETAGEIATKFNKAGVVAEALSAKTEAAVRASVLARFARGEVLALINVDLFGEGFDVPAAHVVSFGRATASLGLYLQQFGRVLRPVYAPGYDLSTREGRLSAIAASPKPYAVVFDHVGNVKHFGLPDAPREWSLDRREKRSSGASDAEAVRYCVACTSPYHRYLKQCPFCGHYPEPAARTAPEFVDGDLLELDATTLAAMRAAVAQADRLKIPQGVPEHAVLAVRKRHAEQQEAQAALRESVAWWGGYQRAAGREDSESYRRFYLTFGTDVLTARTLNRADALALAERVNVHLAKEWVSND